MTEGKYGTRSGARRYIYFFLWIYAVASW
jgi:hypothetical protein